MSAPRLEASALARKQAQAIAAAITDEQAAAVSVLVAPYITQPVKNPTPRRVS